MTTPSERPVEARGSGGPSGDRRRIMLLIVALAVVALVTTAGVRVERKVQHDPAFCTTSCHHKSEAVNDGTHALAHADATCQGCHAVSTGAALKLYWASLTHNDHPKEHGKVTASACESCHAKRPAEWRLVQETAGHREHRVAKNVDCLSCHSVGSRGEASAVTSCVSCHEDQRLHKSTTANAETCLSCHNYTASAKRAKEPSTIACAKCHDDRKDLVASAGGTEPRAMKDVNAHALHGDVACQLCHNAHGKKAVAPPGQAVCARCHQFETFQVGNLENRRGPEEHFKCEGCHKSHAPLKSALETCVNCHEKNAKGITAASVGKTTALKHENCASCHIPHTWVAERSGCMQCHKDKAELIRTRSPPQHDACTKCHDVHGPAPNGGVCVGCHSKTKGNHVARAPQRHKDCTSCHNPHAPLPQETRGVCTKCHSAETNLVMTQGPEGHSKTTCFGCHQPHEDPRPPANICANCHAEKAKAVATAPPPKHKVCTSCHDNHKFRVSDVTSTCSKCHGNIFPAQSAGSTQATVPHQGDCKNCHTIHGPPGVAQASCLQCHAKVATEFKAANEKHGVCKSCHQPHTPAATAQAKCATCHEAKAAVATKWPAGSAHAGACNGCHQQHDVRNKKVCANCHAQEAQSAIGGKHQCQQCHAPHNAPPGTGKAWWSRCNECHADKVAGAAQRGPMHQKCDNCHKPHKFAVPACQSCHQDMASRGLHASPKHAANCQSCHEPHTKAEPTPAQCRACHTNKANHEPNAKRCQACHMFK